MALPTIDIKGKKYVLVSDRVLYFKDTYKNGSIRTELLSPLDADTVVMKATIYPDVSELNRFFTGYSQATWNDGYINKTSALENCETSAVGRALGLMGIGVIDSIASVDEIRKAENTDFLKSKFTKKTANPSTEPFGHTFTCSDCKAKITYEEDKFSRDWYGKRLCRTCQKNYNKLGDGVNDAEMEEAQSSFDRVQDKYEAELFHNQA